MKSVRVEVGKSLEAAPYTIQVPALDEANRLIGGMQHFEGKTPIELVRVLSMSYGNLFGHLKILMSENKRLRARLHEMRHLD